MVSTSQFSPFPHSQFGLRLWCSSGERSAALPPSSIVLDPNQLPFPTKKRKLASKNNVTSNWASGRRAMARWAVLVL